jgi:methylenetetrahydrofolate reductase (NADPH)
MKVIDHINGVGDGTLFSIEILPPLKGKGIESLFKGIEPLMEFKPAFVDVTYHREEYVYKKRAGGFLEKVSIRKRPGTVGICAAIMNRFNIDAVPHIICGGFSREETENALIDLNFLGIDNVLVLQGDSIKTERDFVPEPGGHAYASDLVEQVVNMNNGRFLDEDLKDAERTDFCIGVAGYPEKHIKAPNRKTDLRYLKKKVDAGAEYIVTQMFFDNAAFFRFVDECREAGIHVPIIPGIKPITAKNQVRVLPSMFHIDLPPALTDALDGCKDNEAAFQVGVEWCIAQCKELVEAKVPCIHFYTMGRSEATKAVASEVF